MTTSADKTEEVPKDEAGYRAYTLKKILALQEEHGDGYIQKLLQNEITNVKKRTAEVLSLDKQYRQQKRETDGVRAEYHRFQELKKKAEAVCQTLQHTMKQRDELTKKMTEEMRENREEAIEQTKEKVQAFKESAEARRAAAEERDRENAQLREKCDTLQLSFQQAYDKFQTDLKEMFTPNAELKKLQDEAAEVNAMQEELKQREREHSACLTGSLLMEKQLEWYDEQFKEFEAISVDPDAVLAIMEKQRTAGEQRISDARKTAETLKKKRVEMESELQELRVKFATLTKKMVQVESGKKAAEKKCRQAQSRLKK